MKTNRENSSKLRSQIMVKRWRNTSQTVFGKETNTRTLALTLTQTSESIFWPEILHTATVIIFGITCHSYTAATYYTQIITMWMIYATTLRLTNVVLINKK